MILQIVNWTLHPVEMMTRSKLYLALGSKAEFWIQMQVDLIRILEKKNPDPKKYNKFEKFIEY